MKMCRVKLSELFYIVTEEQGLGCERSLVMLQGREIVEILEVYLETLQSESF